VARRVDDEWKLHYVRHPSGSTLSLPLARGTQQDHLLPSVPDSSLSGSMEGRGFPGRAHPGFAKTVQRLHSPAARLGEPGWWRPRGFLRETLPEDFLTPHSWPTRSHEANSPRDPGSPVVGLVGFLESAWRARYVNPGTSADGFGHLALHVRSQQPAVEGSTSEGQCSFRETSWMVEQLMICQLSSQFMPFCPGGRVTPSDRVASIAGMTGPIRCLA